MPKVKEDYFENKKNIILDATETICSKKPLYNLKMKDVITETKLSPGAIYATFKDIDDVITGMFQRFGTADIFNQTIENIGKEDVPPHMKLKKLLEEAVTFIQSIPQLEVKLMYEINTLAGADKERGEKLARKLEGVSTAIYIPTLLNLIETNIELGIFKPSVPKESIYSFIMAFYDGLLRDITFVKCYNFGTDKPMVTFEEKELPIILSKSVLSLLNVSTAIDDN
ncbi:MAG: TetR/AcrR family transcriptional regulator [Filifactoraceae bacterium]